MVGLGWSEIIVLGICCSLTAVIAGGAVVAVVILAKKKPHTPERPEEDVDAQDVGGEG